MNDEKEFCRLAILPEESFLNAYFEPFDNGESVLLGSIRIKFAVESSEIREKFENLMVECVELAIKKATGQEVNTSRYFTNKN